MSIRLAAMLLVAAPAMAMASGLASVSSGDIGFSIDTAVFRLGAGDSVLVEVYQSVPIDQFSRDDQGFVEFETDVVLLGPAADTLAVRQWVSRVEATEGRSIVNGAMLLASTGNHTVCVTVTDLANGRIGAVERALELAIPVGLSDLEVANAVIPAQEESENPLRKGGLIVFPAADGRFDLPGESTAYLYVEIYGHGGGTVSRQSRLVSAQDEVLFARPWGAVEIPEGMEAAGVLDSLDLGAARTSGLHYLDFSIATGTDTLTIRKPIMIARAEETASIPLFPVGGDGRERFLAQLRLLLTSEEQDLYDDLTDDEARARYYDSYWESRPGGREEFERNCLGSAQFATAFREGWRTDRGRVFITYGQPDEIERTPFQVEGFPYEVWYYYEPGDDTFVFVDRDGSGNYLQIYSTLEGEVSYPNWQQMLQPVRTTTSTVDDEGIGGCRTATQH